MHRYLLQLTTCADILDVYTIEEIIEYNDLTTEELLIYLVQEKIIKLPGIKPLP